MNKKKRLYTLVVTLMPIINIYAVPGINSLGLGEAIGILVVIYFGIVSKTIIIKFYPKQYWMFVIYMSLNALVFTILINSYSFSETILRIMKMLFYTVIIFVCSKKEFDFDDFVKIYINICIIASVYLCLQFFTHFLIGIDLPTVFKNLPILHENMQGAEYNAKIIAIRNLQYRASGFFTEPAGFCMYVSWASPILLFTSFGEKKYAKASLTIIIIAILVSQSAIGYLGIVVSFGVWCLVNLKRLNRKRLIFITAISFVFMTMSIRYGLLEQVAYRISTVSANAATTGTVRLLRGLIIFNKLPSVYKIFGIGAGNYASFVEKYNITTMFDNAIGQTSEYMNLFSMILVYGGIVGFIIYLIGLKKIIFGWNYFKLTVLLLFIMLGTSANIFYSSYYVLPMLLLSANGKGKGNTN